MNKQVSFTEFVLIMAAMTGFLAMSIDLMLPALAHMQSDLGVERSNDIQWVITTVFIGVGLGQFLYGPLSDSVGRKPAVYLGFVIFIIGTLIALFSTTLESMLLGRLLQGLGLAGPRIVTIAIVQDQYSGPQMARVMSLIMTVFVSVPVIAPMIGQGILAVSGWRAIFAVLFVLALVVLFWFAIRLQETLHLDKRKSFSWIMMWSGIKEFGANKAALSYVAALGMALGGFLGFLSSIPLIFLELYGLGDQFPYYFACLAAGIGAASFLNSRLVLKYGMQSIVQTSQLVAAVLSLIALLGCMLFGAVPSFWFLFVYLFLLMFPIGMQFGNLSTLALSGYAHIAGIASSFVGVASMLLSVVFGSLIGQLYNQTLLPLVVGFLLLSICSYGVTRWAARHNQGE